MRAHIWGCRGSLAAPGPDTVRTGGNTSCVELRTEAGDLIILDAGTGLRALGLHLATEEPRTVHLLLSHLHLDHLEGLGFFGPLWDPKVEFHFWGPPSPVTSLKERIARYLSPPLFPVHISDVPSKPTFHDVPSEEFQIGSASILAARETHEQEAWRLTCACSGRGPLRCYFPSALLFRVAGYAAEARIRWAAEE